MGGGPEQLQERPGRGREHAEVRGGLQPGGELAVDGGEHVQQIPLIEFGRDLTFSATFFDEHTIHPTDDIHFMGWAGN